MRQRTLDLVSGALGEWHPTRAQHSDIATALDCAMDLEAALYSGEDVEKPLFRLRKSLEGLFGHEYGDEPHIEERSSER